MSFGGFGSTSGGFGQNNNNNNPTGFGGGSTGFGSNTTGGAFGSTNTGPAFGSNTNTGGSIFGTGSGGGGFGTSNTTSAFGQNKPAFGATGTTGTTGGLFGSGNTTTGGFGSGGGGFGTSNSTGTGFGSGTTTTGGGLFGQNKSSAFGTSTTSGGIFGASNTNTNPGGFGSSTPSTFGNNANTGSGSAFTQVSDATGTANPTFAAFSEKENNSNVTNHFQSITFMGPYQKHSFEELRLADYAKGQKHGNASGQAGAFGQTTGFGGTGFGSSNNNNTSGFGGNTSGGLFGNTATTSASTGFGTNTATSGGFGGGMFGQNKPANQGGLFGTTSNTNAGGGLFGGGSTGFGNTQQQNQTSNTLFGQNNNSQAKPGGLFGTGTNPAPNTGFGATNSTGGGLFGNNNNNTNTQQPAGGLFGGGQQQQQTSNPFGTANATTTNTGFGGGFGNNNQAKPAGGLFGNNTNTGGTSLFGNNQTQGATGFGANQNQQQSGGLFGNGAQGQASTGGLFGNNANNQQKPSLFGNNTNTTGGGLFGGGQQQQQQQPGGLFGQSQPQNQTSGFGGSLFGNNQQNNQANSSLFGNSQNANNGLLGNTQQQQQNVLQGPAGYTASLTDPSPYGSASIFNGLPPPPQNSPGPIATPINAGSVRGRKPAALPQYKLNPSAASRLITPQKRGYGLSYSTYGTPSSVASVTSTPGALTGSLLGGSLGRSLGKSFSTNNLRSQMESEPSVLGAGALTGSLRMGSSGSLKRLTIDRSLRTDLFGSQSQAALPPSGPPAPTSNTDEPRPTSNLRKTVSFDISATNQNGSAVDGERAESGQPTPQEQGYLRSSRGPSGRASMPSQHEMEQIKGNELAVVHEDQVSASESSQPKDHNLFSSQLEPQPGQYWMEPSLSELKKMTAQELKALRGFQVGRNNTGFVQFDEPVDLTHIDLDRIAEDLVVITPRTLTVYPNNSDKPKAGYGLNVPSTITLENCWPRGRDRKTRVPEKNGPRVTKHIERLKRHDGTTFVNYDVDSGKWTFKVPHYTTYGLDDEDEVEASAGELGDSVMSEAPPTPTPKGKQVRSTSVSAQDVQPSSSALSSVPSDMSFDFDDSRVSSTPGDDTFGFRRGKRFPGAFDDMPAFDESEPEDESMEMAEAAASNDFPSPVSAPSEDEPVDADDNVFGSRFAPIRSEEDTMIGAFPDDDDEAEIAPTLRSPVKLIPDLNDDWAERLQHTISPRKNDRRFLKQSQALLDRGESLLDIDTTPTARRKNAVANQDLGEIRTSVDLMRSLFGKEEMRRSGHKEKKTGIQWPYNKRDPNDAQSNMSEQELAFHQSFKSSFTPNNRIVIREQATQVAVYNVNEEPKDISPHNFFRLLQQTKVSVRDDVPAAIFEPRPFDQDWGVRDTAHHQEITAWKLLHVLFDDYSDEISKAIPDSELMRFKHRIRKDRLAELWAQLCEPAAAVEVTRARSHEERAVAYLSMNKVVEACNTLIEGKNYRLATLVAQIGSDATQKAEMRKQIESWSQGNLLSEMSDAIRAILSMLAGNTSLVEGRRGAVEDKADSFVISEKFHMDWKRAFGLRLWYGILPDESLETAVQKFAEDLAHGDETQKPIPWFLESGSSTISNWKDPKPESRQDLLWAILTLVAQHSRGATNLALAEALSPENLVGTPMSFRLSFELHQMLASKLPRAVNNTKADALTASFAASLEGHGQWQSALWVLLFLSQHEQRMLALKSALARMAPLFKNEKEIRDVIFIGLRIPESWVWDAKALQARAEGHKPDEVTYLARAHKWVDAHQVLCEEVAPLAIIERHHQKLHIILEKFPQRHLPEWRLGGQVYEDYLSLIDGKLGGPETRVISENLISTLAELKPHSGDGRKMSFTQSVALTEIARVALEKVNEQNGQEVGPGQSLESLALPGNEEIRRLEIGNVGMRHLKAIMANSA